MKPETLSSELVEREPVAMQITRDALHERRVTKNFLPLATIPTIITAAEGEFDTLDKNGRKAVNLKSAI